MMYHNPVLLNECLDGLRIDPKGIYADLTFGGGGHSRAILEKLNSGHLYAFDQDADAEANIPDDKNFTLVRHNFRFLKNFLRYYKVDGVDGILADLGVSSHQFDKAERGFSIRFDAPLDMRMNNETELTAATVINEYDEESLTKIFKQYGELKNSKQIAARIIKERQNKPLETTAELIDLVKPIVPQKIENKVMAMLFQAIRIEVNDELGALKEALEHCLDVLKPGGRLVVISYHSLEDRLVKHFMRSGNFEDKQDKDFFGRFESPFKLISKGAIIPTDEEIEQNSRARSAKLRIAEKI